MFKLETLEGFLEPVTTQNSCIQTLKQPFNSRTSRTHQLIFKVWLFSSYSDIINQKSNSKINLSGITCGTKSHICIHCCNNEWTFWSHL